MELWDSVGTKIFNPLDGERYAYPGLFMVDVGFCSKNRK